MNLELENKKALVSGSTAGIGLAIASRLAREGAEVWVNGRTQERVDEAIAEIKKDPGDARLHGIAADLGTAEGCAEVVRGLEDVLGRPLGANDLDERHQRRRIEEVHPDHALGPLEHRRDLGHRKRRCVRSEDRVVPNDSFQRPEELVLHREVLERRFDHEIAPGEVGELRRQAEPRDRSVTRVLLELALLDLTRQEVRNPVASRLAATCLDFTSDRVKARLDGKLRDAGAHGPEADDADLHTRSTTPAIAMPKPTHIDAIP